MTEDVLTVIDRLSGIERTIEGQRTLQDAIRDLGLDHVAYFAVNLPGTEAERGLHAVTYAPAWQRHYIQSGYVNVDPVVRAGLAGILPVDWATIDKTDRVVRKFFGEAQDFAIGSQGLSFPIRGRHHEFAMLSVTADVSPREWLGMRHRLTRDLMLLAYHFHDFTLRSLGLHEANNPLDQLTAREKDCLRWRALGKSDWDIGKVLCVSERTVKFHLGQARHKLGAMNTTHAVTKALTLGLIAVA